MKRSAAPFFTLAVVGLVLFRSALFLFRPGLNFDSDQAITGLMAKHLSGGTAFPLFFYGQSYLLAVEAWLAAPMFLLFGVSVASLKLPLVAINIAIGLLLVALLKRELGLTPAHALTASLLFVIAPPETSAMLVNTLGGTVEPLLYVLLLWMTRRRPIWFGIIAGIGFLHREFTLYGVVAIFALDAAAGELTSREEWRRWLRAAAVAIGVFVVVQLLWPLSSPMGPDTTMADLLKQNGNSVSSLFERFCFDPATFASGLTGLVTRHWTRLFGTEPRPLIAFADVEGRAVQGLRGASLFFGVAGVLMIARLAVLLRSEGRSAKASAERGSAGAWRRYEFAIYLMLVGLMSAAVLALGRCGEVETLRYDLLSLFLMVGVVGCFFAVEQRQWLRGAGVALVLAWAAMSTLGHAELWSEFATKPPVSDKMVVMRALDARGIKYATADYWMAYYITFLSNERIIVASEDFPRILRYGDRVQQHQSESVRISRAACDGGDRVIEGVYFCPP